MGGFERQFLDLVARVCFVFGFGLGFEFGFGFDLDLAMFWGSERRRRDGKGLGMLKRQLEGFRIEMCIGMLFCDEGMGVRTVMTGREVKEMRSEDGTSR